MEALFIRNVHGSWRFMRLRLLNARSCATGFVGALMAFLSLSMVAEAHVRLDNPLGGEMFAGGDMIEIQWDAYIYHGEGTIDLDFSENGGTSYTPIVSDIPILSSAEMLGAYMWTVPVIDSDLCLVRVTYTTDMQSIYTGISSSFTIGSPTGGGGVDPGDGTPGEFVVTIDASKDNTLYEDPAGALSNGAGDHLFAGKTGMDSIRRGLIAFDISAAIPSGATITRVALSLNVSKVASASTQEVALIPMAADWGEGLSDAPLEEGMGTAATDGDATWIHSFSPSFFWNTPGGDFASGTTATVSVAGTGAHTFVSTAAMIADVQVWLDSPANNWGWLVVGTESSSGTAVRFDTRENGIMANRPALTIDYDLGGGGDGGGSCFIATAAYGTPLAAELGILRQFRDAYLLDTSAGAALVDTYYRISPSIANKVSMRPALGAVVRLFLMPVLLLATVLLNWPALAALLLTTILGAIVLHCRRRDSRP